jgi:hypothetical protein
MCSKDDTAMSVVKDRLGRKGDGVVGRPMSQPRAATIYVAPGGTGGEGESASHSFVLDMFTFVAGYTTVVLTCARRRTISVIAEHGVKLSQGPK